MSQLFTTPSYWEGEAPAEPLDRGQYRLGGSLALQAVTDDTSRHPRSAAPSLSVVIVNYQQWENTAALAEQVLASPAGQGGTVEIIVVDNHSPPHRSIPRLRRTDGISLRRWRQNRGFARAVNEAVRLSRGDWLLLLNPDMTIPNDFIDGVLRTADRISASEPRTGIVGFQVRNSDRSLQPSAGSFPTLLRTLLGLALPRAQRKCRLMPSRKRCHVDWVSGCCLLLRRKCFDELGGLDRRFFLYYEDVDLCRRARDHGWSVCYDPSLWAIHHHPVHQRKMSSALRLIIRHSLLTYSAQHWPAADYRILASIIRAEGWFRRLWARCWRKDADFQASRQLSVLAGEMAHGDWRGARRRIIQASRGA